MAFEKITESESAYRHLEQMSVLELLTNINKEDETVPAAIAKEISNSLYNNIAHC